ncbi:MAG: HAD hydrolase family protein [Planctomycetota bacterium]
MTDPTTHAALHRRFDAVICDNDGCLSPEDQTPFDIASLALIREHNRLAHEVGDRPSLTLCTGRPIAFVEAMARLLGCTLPVMGENGAYLWFPDRNRFELDPAITTDQLDAVEELEHWIRADFVPRGVSIQPGKTASVSLHHDDTELLRTEVRSAVEARVAEEGWPLRVSMTWFYINCDLTHVSKATAIDRFCAHTGLTSDRLAGIGDTTSDRFIRERVAWFGCPANAQDDVKAFSDAVSGATLAEGVVELLSGLTDSAPATER